MSEIATRLRLLLAAASLTLAGAVPAEAALYTQVYTGTITSGYDNVGVFKAGQFLNGLTYTATFLIDDSKGYTDGFGGEGEPLGGSRIYGGGIYKDPNSPVTATLTINGETVSFLGTFQSTVSQASGATDTGSSIVSDQNASLSQGLILYEHSSSTSDYLTDDFRDALDYAFTPSDSTYGYFNAPGGAAYGNMTITRIVSGPVASAVPEPAAWALMIGGFGIAGGALRRRTVRMTRPVATTA